MAKTTGYTGRDRGTKVFKQFSANGVINPSGASFAFAAGASNVAEVEISVVDADGNLIPGVHQLTVFLSDASTGVGLTGTSASGTVQAKAASGTDVGILTAKKALLVNTLASGKYTLEITATGKTGYYIAAKVPGVNDLHVSRQMVSGDYGA